MQTASSAPRIRVPVFDFIDIHPSPIKHISVSEAKLLVSRQKCSEVYAVLPAATVDDIAIEQILRFEPCEQMYQLDGILVVIKPFELRAYDKDTGSWTVHPFTTQFAHSSFKNNCLYTFHEKQSLKWEINEESGVRASHLQKSETPYHVTVEGNIQGHGKKIKPNVKGTKFTVCQFSECRKYLFIGTDSGHLHIYETKFLTHINTVKRHEAAILTITVDGNCCYFSGSDSKVSSLILANANKEDENWVLSTEVRGQSHDIFSLAMLNSNGEKYLISGGITTDLCFYPITGEVLSTEWSHKISYSSEKLVECIDQYFFVNKFTQFQIWKVQPPTTAQEEKVELIVRYELPFHKHIQQLTVAKCVGKGEQIAKNTSSQQYLVMVCCQFEAVSWLFDEENGLIKFSTISNSYSLVRGTAGESFITLRDGNKVEKLDYKTGRIKELLETEITLPTDLIINYNGDEQRIVIGSKYSKEVEVYLIKGKSCKLQARIQLPSIYNVLDVCYSNPQNLLIKFSNEAEVKQMDAKGNIVKDEIVKAPFNKIRQYGWAQVQLAGKRKVYWYLVGENKIAIISGMKTLRPKKIRTRQMVRIGNVISNPLALLSAGMDEEGRYPWQRWSLGVVGLNFGRMIAEQSIKPVFTKKIV